MVATSRFFAEAQNDRAVAVYTFTRNGVAPGQVLTLCSDAVRERIGRETITTTTWKFKIPARTSVRVVVIGSSGMPGDAADFR